MVSAQVEMSQCLSLNESPSEKEGKLEKSTENMNISMYPQ